MLMQSSPVMQAMAQAVVAADDRAISSVSLLAPLSHGPARLLVTWAGLDCPTRITGMIEGADITVIAWSKHPDHITQLPPLTAPEAAILEAAWAWGAWDIVRTCHGPGYNGALPEEWDAFAPDLRAQGWVVWTFRPMMGGPEVRLAAHRRDKRTGKADITLHPVSMGRHEAMPDVRPPPIRPGTQHIITLGTEAARRARGRVPPSTPRQIALIGHLRKEAGDDTQADPRRMTIREASAEIERLTGKSAPRKAPQMTVSQHRTIIQLMQARRIRQIDHPEAPQGDPFFWRISYAEAQRWIAYLQGR